jgi:phospholipase A-2-activating protein
MQSKIHQIHQALYADTSTAATLTTSDMQTIDDIFEFLKIAISRPSLSPSTAKQLDWSDVEVVVHVMSRWPESSRFPAIDLARLVSAYSPTVLSVEKHAWPFYEGLFLAMDWNSKPWPQPLPKHRETNILIGLRAVANAFQIGSDGKGVGTGPWNEQLFETLLTTGWSSLVKTHWVALATIAFNYSCVAALKLVDEKTRSLHLQLVMKILADEGPDAESSYRALVALGNVLHAAKVASIPIRANALSILKEAVAITKSKHSDEERFRVVLKEVEALL